MSRQWVIIVCIFNVCLAGGLILYLSTGAGRTPPRSLTPELPTFGDVSTDAERWTRAREALTPNEVHQLLARIEDTTGYRSALAELLQEMNTSESIPVAQWDTYSVYMQFFGKWTQSGHDLQLLATLAGNQALPLNLRDVAFRNYIQRFAELAGAETDWTAAYTLTDQFYREPTALMGTALQAENFMLQKADYPDRKEQLLRQIDRCLGSGNSPEVNQFTALAVLSGLDVPVQVERLEQVFNNSCSERVQTSVLELLARREVETGLEWVQAVSPQTPRQERLLMELKQGE